MTVDRYTKAVLTVIAACLVWLSVGGPSLITPVSAQASGDRVILAGWLDGTGAVVSFPPAPPAYQRDGAFGPYREVPRGQWPLPMTEAVK